MFPDHKAAGEGIHCTWRIIEMTYHDIGMIIYIYIYIYIYIRAYVFQQVHIRE